MLWKCSFSFRVSLRFCVSELKPYSTCVVFILSYYRLLRLGAKIGRTLESVNAQLLRSIIYFSHIPHLKRQPSITLSQFYIFNFLFPQWSRFESWFRYSMCNVVDMLWMFISVGLLLQLFLSEQGFFKQWKYMNFVF